MNTLELKINSLECELQNALTDNDVLQRALSEKARSLPNRNDVLLVEYCSDRELWYVQERVGAMVKIGQKNWFMGVSKWWDTGCAFFNLGSAAAHFHVMPHKQRCAKCTATSRSTSFAPHRA